MSLRKLADEFALKVVAGNYKEAHEMLSDVAKSEWTPNAIKEEFEAMYEDLSESKPFVITDWNDENGETDLDNGTLLYVPIDSEDGWSEAISIIINSSNQIIEIEFGRP